MVTRYHEKGKYSGQIKLNLLYFATVSLSTYMKIVMMIIIILVSINPTVQ